MCLKKFEGFDVYSFEVTAQISCHVFHLGIGEPYRRWLAAFIAVVEHLVADA